MSEQAKREVWFLTGTQHLYGEATLRQVEAHSKEIAGALDATGKLPVRVVWKPILVGPEGILDVCLAANAATACVGVITWMHTFSPAKMWIAGLTRLQKPLAHLHTQYNRELPWGEIDMDFMNLNQAAHGDREYGFIGARLRLERKIVVGHWQEPEVAEALAGWARSALAMDESRRLKIARFGGANMREVAVTGGDRVEAQIKLGWAINAYPVGGLVKRMGEVPDADVERLLQEYDDVYEVAPALRKGGEKRETLRDAARQELGMRRVMDQGGFGAFTTTFEDLYGLGQLPGLACQRLMASGYGFAGEGDWKTAGLVRLLKVMEAGRKGGSSFMEDYTYHLVKGKEVILGAHMLEVCPSIAAGKARLEVHPLGIGGKGDPARLVFDAGTGPAINASLVDMGGRMRLIVAELDAVKAEHPMPKLPVARALWIPRPDFRRGAEAWILAGAAHHSVFTQSVDIEQLRTFADLMGIECVVIDEHTRIPELKQTLQWNEVYYKFCH